MRIVSTISLLAVAILLFFSASNVALAKEGASLIDQLSEIDVFHPPSINEPRILLYNEWHYFNVIDEEQGLSFVTTLKLNGDIHDESNFLPDPFMSSANVLIDYHTPDDINSTIEGITEVEYSTETPDLKMNNNTVKLAKNGYDVHVESSDGQTVFDALFKPDTELVPLFSVVYDSDMVINWLPASSKMKVTGTLTVNKGTPMEKTYTLKNVRGYHDHNWGYWSWSDDIGWNWGQASETKNHLNGNDIGKYTFSFGDITNNSHTESKGAVLHFWKNKKMIADFKNNEMDNEMEIQHNGYFTIFELPDNPCPIVTVLDAASDEGTINILFTTEYATPIPIPIGIDEYLVIWEITGTYDVNGFINGKPVSYTTKGFLEYVA